MPHSGGQRTTVEVRGHLVEVEPGSLPALCMYLHMRLGGQFLPYLLSQLGSLLSLSFKVCVTGTQEGRSQ